ncbi:hypothetical protein [Leptonema illini]|nr:hypothetical protein [Leptonema illini]
MDSFRLTFSAGSAFIRRMSGRSIKSTILEEINAIENEETLVFIQDIILNITGNQNTPLPESVKSGIAKGISEIESGKFYSEEEADSKVDQWFRS